MRRKMVLIIFSFVLSMLILPVIAIAEELPVDVSLDVKLDEPVAVKPPVKRGPANVTPTMPVKRGPVAVKTLDNAADTVTDVPEVTEVEKPELPTVSGTASESKPKPPKQMKKPLPAIDGTNSKPADFVKPELLVISGTAGEAVTPVETKTLPTISGAAKEPVKLPALPTKSGTVGEAVTPEPKTIPAKPLPTISGTEGSKPVCPPPTPSGIVPPCHKQP